MLDKTVPYFDLKMKRKAGTKIPDVILPQGYSFVTFSQGDEENWADIETKVGWFENRDEALQFFNQNYLPFLTELKNRVIFVKTEDNELAAAIINWWNYADKRVEPTLHYLAVKPKYQGIGLGRAIVSKGMENLINLEGDIDVYLHTQTWSYKAIGLYYYAGFRFLEGGFFCGTEEDYNNVWPIFEEKIRIRK